MRTLVRSTLLKAMEAGDDILCPGCDKQAVYVAWPDRFYHWDGSENRGCWQGDWADWKKKERGTGSSRAAAESTNMEG